MRRHDRPIVVNFPLVEASQRVRLSARPRHPVPFPRRCRRARTGREGTPRSRNRRGPPRQPRSGPVAAHDSGRRTRSPGGTRRGARHRPAVGRGGVRAEVRRGGRAHRKTHSSTLAARESRGRSRTEGAAVHRRVRAAHEAFRQLSQAARARCDVFCRAAAGHVRRKLLRHPGRPTGRRQEPRGPSSSCRRERRGACGDDAYRGEDRLAPFRRFLHPVLRAPRCPGA